MTVFNRVDKLFSALTARERALMVLRAWKDGGEEDRQVRSAMPDAQVAEFNRLIEVMNGVNEQLGKYLLLLRAFTEQLGLIDGWLSTMILWASDVADLGYYIFRHTPEPITESDYVRLKGSRKKEPRPAWGLRFEVFPDSEAGQVGRLQDERARVRKAISRAPLNAWMDAELKERAHCGRTEETWDSLVQRVKDRTIQYWLDLRAIEIVCAQAAEEFDGEDPAIPEVRAIVAWIRPELIGLHQKATTIYGQKFELAEPDDLRVEAIRRIARWPEQRTDLSDGDLIRHITVNLSERDGDHQADEPTDGHAT